MTKRRMGLVARRVEAGFKNQQAFYDELKKKGVVISFDSYKNIESGRCKNVDVFTAICISDVLDATIEEIFLPLSTQKMRRTQSGPDSVA